MELLPFHARAAACNVSCHFCSFSSAATAAVAVAEASTQAATYCFSSSSSFSASPLYCLIKKSTSNNDCSSVQKKIIV